MSKSGVKYQLGHRSTSLLIVCLYLMIMSCIQCVVNVLGHSLLGWLSVSVSQKMMIRCKAPEAQRGMLVKVSLDVTTPLQYGVHLLRYVKSMEVRKLQPLPFLPF